MPNQTVSVHPDKVYDIVGSPADTTVTLTNLVFAPTQSPVGVMDDSDTSDNDSVLNTAGVVVGDTATLTFEADGSDGKRYEAIADVTVVAPEIVVEPMALVFTERA